MNAKIYLAAAIIASFAFIAVIPMEETSAASVTLDAKTLYMAGSQTYSYASGTSITINNNDNPPDYAYIVSGSNSFTLTSTTTKTIQELDDDFNVMGSVTVTFTVSSPPPTYTYYLYYNANGGSGAPSTQSTSNTTGGTYNFTISSTTPSRSNYTFDGWSENSAATVAEYGPGDTIGVSQNSSVTLYAVWNYTPTYTYTLNYNANGGSGAPSTQTQTSTFSSYTFTISMTTPTRTDYTFDGWSENSAATVADYGPGDTLTVNSGSPSITLYAVWNYTPTYTYTLNYNANGGSGAPSTQTATSTLTSYNFTISMTTPTRTDYTFDGWSENSAATVADYGPGETIGLNYQDNSVTLYAVWISTPTVTYTYTLNYDANGGSGAPAAQTASNTTGGSYNFTISMTTPTRTDYTFDGWSENSAATSADYGPGDTIGVSENSTVTLYAVWDREVATDGVYWSNDNYNGRVVETFRFTGGSSNMAHTMSYDLYAPTTSNGVTTWSLTGYSVQMAISYYPQTVISSTLMFNGSALTGQSSLVNLGQWPAFNLTLDANTSKIFFTPISNFVNFTNFKELTNQTRTILDYSAVTSGSAILEIKHEDTGTGAHVNFSVTSTDVFLNTYGVVLYNPSINPFSYFPEYQSIRLDFRSFAIYGDSFMLNGNTFQVDRGTVTFWYTVDEEKVNHIASEGTEGALQKTLQLSNIQVTWENGSVSLTFVNDRFTVDLGEYSAGSETISFQGYWYFTTTLGEPYTVTERSISGDWKSVPDIGTSAILLIFLGILLIGGLVAHAKLGLKWLDAIIVICSLIFAYALLG